MNAWEQLGANIWGLCTPFGPRSDQPGTLGRIELQRWFDGWRLLQHSAVLGETEAVDKNDVEAAKAWGLTELASIARDRAMRYAEQTYTLMSSTR